MDEITLQLAKLAAELDTIKLLGVILTFAFIAIITLVVLINRNAGSQNRTTENTVTGFFTLITTLSVSIDKLSEKIGVLAVDFESIDNKIDNSRAWQISQTKKLDAILNATLDTNQWKAIKNSSDTEIPDMSNEKENE